ncbi:MAG: glycosyltransferase [Gemmataceae bacterium]
MTATPRLSIVIPTFNRPDLLRRCLETVTLHSPPATQVIVVDDAAPNRVVVDVVNDFPHAAHLRQPRRLGFAAAANAGIRASTGAIVELLNDDTEVQSGWAEAALAHFDDATIGAVAPLVLSWPDGTRIDSAGDRYYRGGVAAKRGHGQPLDASFLQARPVFGASASSAFYRRAALERVGLFPESFGSYFEDVDLAFRLQRAGYGAMFEPASRVLHHGGASHRPERRLLGRQSLNEERVFWRNMPLASLPGALPRHLLVLIGKGLRRWSEGTFWPFLWGRVRLLTEIPELLRHRRALTRLGGVGDWQVDDRYHASDV